MQVNLQISLYISAPIQTAPYGSTWTLKFPLRQGLLATLQDVREPLPQNLGTKRCRSPPKKNTTIYVATCGVKPGVANLHGFYKFSARRLFLTPVRADILKVRKFWYIIHVLFTQITSNTHQPTNGKFLVDAGCLLSYSTHLQNDSYLEICAMYAYNL